MVTLKLESISAIDSQNKAKQIYAEMIIKGKPVAFHVDCGATVNVIPAKYLEREEIRPMERVTNVE